MEIKGISIKSFHDDPNGHGDSRTFSAVLYMDGKKVGVTRNSGHGGPNEYQFCYIATEKIHETRDEFYKRTKEWGKENDESFEIEDALIEALILDLENQKVKRSNIKKGYPVTLLCKRGAETLPKTNYTFYNEQWLVGLLDDKQIDGYVKKEKIEKWTKI